jgi:subtilisin family serine protease
MRLLRIAYSSIFFLLFTLNAQAQYDGILPPGNFPVGPFAAHLQSEAKPGEVLVKFRGAGLRAIQSSLKKRLGRLPSKRAVQNELARALGLRTSEPLSGTSYVVKGSGLNKAKLSALYRKGYLEKVVPNYKLYALGAPNDFLYKLGLEWGINNTGGGGGSDDVDVDAVEAWDTTTGSPDVVVAIVDTGVSLKHPDLVQNIWTNPAEIPNNGIDDDGNGFVDDVHGYDFVDNDPVPDDQMFHGTHCAGIVAASSNNNRGIAGVAPGVKILPVRVLNAKGEGDNAGVMKGIRYALDLKKKGANIAVISASLGGPDRVDAFEDLLKEANAAGILFVAAAGNETNDNDEKATYPANYNSPNIVSVAAVDRNGELASFSNYGRTTVDVAAPGVFIWSTFLFGFYLPFDGTSMAAPFVSGVAALVVSEHPGIAPSQVVSILKRSVKPLDSLQGKIAAPGIVSAERALALAR